MRGFVLSVGLAVLVTSSAAAAPPAAKASVKGWVTEGEARHELTSVAVLQDGPGLVLLITDKAIPAGKAKAFASDLLEGTGLRGIKMGLPAPGSEPSAKEPSPLFVQFLPGDGTLMYTSGGASPWYEFQPEAMTPKRVAGRLHGTIVTFPVRVDVDVTFDTPVE